MCLASSPYNNQVRSILHVVETPIITGDNMGRVGFMRVGYDKLELSFNGMLKISVPNGTKLKETSDSQVEAIRLGTPHRRNVLYKKVYNCPKGVVILREPEFINIPLNPNTYFSLKNRTKVLFNGSRHSSIFIGDFMRSVFPNDWQKFVLSYYEVAYDFSADLIALSKGIYRKGVKVVEHYEGTTYFGSKNSSKRMTIYNKQEEQAAKDYKIGPFKTRIEERIKLAAKESPSISKWLSGIWKPSVLNTTLIANTAIRWPGLTNTEWALIKRDGLQKALQSKSISKKRKAKIRKIARENRWLLMDEYADQELWYWTLDYRKKYVTSHRLLANYSKHLDAKQSKWLRARTQVSPSLTYDMILRENRFKHNEHLTRTG